MKTGRMAPVERQLTNGALTSSNGLCVHTSMFVQATSTLKRTSHRQSQDSKL